MSEPHPRKRVCCEEDVPLFICVGAKRPSIFWRRDPFPLCVPPLSPPLFSPLPPFSLFFLSPYALSSLLSLHPSFPSCPLISLSPHSLQKPQKTLKQALNVLSAKVAGILVTIDIFLTCTNVSSSPSPPPFSPAQGLDPGFDFAVQVAPMEYKETNLVRRNSSVWQIINCCTLVSSFLPSRSPGDR